MRGSFLFTLLAALPCAVLAQDSTSACPPSGIHFIAGPGEGGDAGDYGNVSSLVLSAQAAIPGSNNFCIGPYGDGSGLAQTENAETQMRNHLDSFSQKCPDAPIVLLGYSAGGIAAINTLCGASPAPPWAATSPMWNKYNIIGSIMYGIETFQAGMPFDLGTCTQNAPMYPRTSSDACEPFWPKMQVYCDSDDGDCCTGGIDGGPAHFDYGPTYDASATAFIQSQWETYKANHKNEMQKHKQNNKPSSSSKRASKTIVKTATKSSSKKASKTIVKTTTKSSSKTKAKTTTKSATKTTVKVTTKTSKLSKSTSPSNKSPNKAPNKTPNKGPTPNEQKSPSKQTGGSSGKTMPGVLGAMMPLLAIVF